MHIHTINNSKQMQQTEAFSFRQQNSKRAIVGQRSPYARRVSFFRFFSFSIIWWVVDDANLFFWWFCVEDGLQGRDFHSLEQFCFYSSLNHSFCFWIELCSFKQNSITFKSICSRFKVQREILPIYIHII